MARLALYSAFGLLLLLAVAAGHTGGEDGYDFIIVGGGLAGSVLANRLTESGEHSVLLLNIAGAPATAYTGPVMVTDEYIVGSNRSADDGLRARIYQPGYKPMPAFSTALTGSSPARFLGGSSIVGLSLYLRDHPEALDKWGEGWDWESLRPYFHAAEKLPETCYGGNRSCGDYGTAGPYRIAKEPAYTHPLTLNFIAAARAAGLPETRELNTHHDAAVGVTPVTQHEDGTKVHAYDAYLRPALGRPNLRVQHAARADRLIIHKGHCRGVAYRDLEKGEDKVVHARREVLLSSGYIYSPRLLFLSGLGDAQALETVGLPVVRDLPAVGKHLTSARFTPLAWNTHQPTLSQMVGAPISPPGSQAVPHAYQSAVQEATARFRSSKANSRAPHEKRPDVVVTFMPLYYAPSSAPLQYSLQGEPWPLKTNAYSLLVTLGETEAQGAVTFPSGSPDVSPVVTHEPLTSRDAEVASEAVSWAKRLGASSAFGNSSLVNNGAGAPGTWSALYDGRGTCRMGKTERDSVVDYKLRVHGIRGLRVVDGSVIPQASPYLAAPEVIALAERAAAMLLDEGVPGSSTRQHDAVEGASIAKLTGELGAGVSLMDIVKHLSPRPARAQSLSEAQSRAGDFGLGSVLVAALLSAIVAGSSVAMLVRVKPVSEAQAERHYTSLAA